MDIRDPDKIVAEGVGQTRGNRSPSLTHHVVRISRPNNARPSSFISRWCKPSAELFPAEEYDTNGILMIGTNDTMLTHYNGGGTLKSGRRAQNLESHSSLAPARMAPVPLR